MNHFEGKSHRFILPTDYLPGNFDKFFIIHHSNGERTHIAQQTKTYATNGDTENLSYLCDMDRDNIIVGHGEIRFNISNTSNYFKDKPFVGYTQTLEGNEKKGLGTRRLYIMNALSQAVYQLPLNSDTLIGEDAEKLWKSLVNLGVAKSYKEGKNNRYAFH